jgi:prepilin-type N-terminal cleavage/methylation domain-containing protein
LNRLVISSAKGFSLIELLCALILFAIVTLGIANSTLTATRTNRDNERQAVAVNLAHQVLECVKAQIQANRVNAGNPMSDCNPAGAPAGYAVSTPSLTPGTGTYLGMTRILVTISWTSPLPDSVTLDTHVDT